MNKLTQYKRTAALNIAFAALFSAFGLGATGCHKKDASPALPTALFDSTPLAKPVTPLIREGSCIAESKANAGYVWVEEDSGNPTQIYLVSHDGTVLKKIFIKGAVNRDWEDMALSGNDLYLGDIGDNNLNHPDYTFYKFPEPLSSVDTVKSFETIKFKYEDGAHDAEAFLVDPDTKDIYIITKRDNPSLIYKLSSPFSSLSTAIKVGALTYSGVTSAAISADGKEILVKTYTNVFYYPLSKDQSIVQALQGKAVQLPYEIEPQGEAITFSLDHSGYYTLSEIGFVNYVNLNFYKRK